MKLWIMTSNNVVKGPIINKNNFLTSGPHKLYRLFDDQNILFVYFDTFRLYYCHEIFLLDCVPPFLFLLGENIVGLSFMEVCYYICSHNWGMHVLQFLFCSIALFEWKTFISFFLLQINNEFKGRVFF